MTTDLDWSDAVLRMNLKGITGALAMSCTMIDFIEEDRPLIRLRLESNAEHLRIESAERALRLALESLLSRPVRLDIHVERGARKQQA